MSETAMPPHPGLEGLKNFEELKHLCPAFSKGCPYAKIEEMNTITVSRGELSRCPAFQEGCPFSKSEEEIATLMKQIPKDHPTLNVTELPSCEEGAALVKQLNSFLDNSQLAVLFDNKDVEKLEVTETAKEPEYLDDPQLASQMREGIKVVHRAVTTGVFAKRFLKGNITADEYGQYINSLYFVYKHMEGLLEKYKDHPVVQIIHFPNELNREESLKNDLEFFYGADRIEELTNPQSMTPAVQKYVQAMDEACDKNPTLLIAHSYSRYLGDLSGGQIIVKQLKKHVFKLKENESTWDTTEGLNFYYFNNLGNQVDFKNFYRERLNVARVDAATRDRIVAEAVLAFELNIALFDEIQALSEANKLTPSSFKVNEEVAGSEQSNNVTPAEPPKKTKCTKGQWMGAVSVTVAAIAIGATVFQRYYNQKK